MSTLPRRQYSIFVTLGLAAVGAAVVAFLLFTAGKAGEVELTTAEFVPADAGVYLGINTSLTSKQWIAAFALVERLGRPAPESELRDGALEANLDWEDDVAPFLGGNAAVYLKYLSASDGQFEGGAVIRCRDCKRAANVVRRESGLDFDGGRHGGISYSGADSLFLAEMKGHLLLAPDADSLFEMIDAGNGNAPSLASGASFKRLRDELSPNFLSFVYFSAEHFVSDTVFDDDAVRRALRDGGAGDVIFGPVAWALSARTEGFAIEAASVGRPGTASPMLAPRSTRFAAMVPRDTSIYVSTHGIAAAWDEAIASAQPEIDDALQEAGFANLDDALGKAGAEIGLTSVDELIGQIEGETSLAVWFPGGDGGAPEAVLLAEVRDRARAADILSKIRSASVRSGQRVERVAGIDITVLSGAGDPETAYALRDDYVILGTVGGVRGLVEGRLGSLTDNPRYADAVRGLSSPTGTFAFFDLHALITLSGVEDAPVDLEQARKALGGAILNLVDERGLARFVGIVSIED